MARIEQSIEVNVPLHTVYNQWTQFEEFPRFMEGVREVRQLDDAHLHWLAERHGKQVEWDSEITDQVPDQRIAWRDISGPKNSGSIWFEPLQPDKTRVRMTMDFQPSASAPEAFNVEREVTHRVEQDLTRFKKMLEEQGGASGAWRGEIHHGQPMPSSGSDAASEAIEHAAGKTVGQTAAEQRAASQSGGVPNGQQGQQASSGSRGIGADGTPGSSNNAGMTGLSGAAGPSAGTASTPGMSGNTGTAGAGFGIGADGTPGSSGAQQVPIQGGRGGVGPAEAHGRSGPQSWLPNLLQGWEDPMMMVRRMSEEMDQLFERFIGRPMASRLGQGGMAGRWMPPVEISHRDNQLVVCADLPGVKREDVQIEISSNKLIIDGERREEGVHMTPQGYRRSERSYGRFYRMIPLPDGVDPESARASMQDGVLEIRIPVPESAGRRGRRIEIQPPQSQ